MNIGTKYTPQLLTERYDAIVIGSGPGGLATAAFLAREGKKVLVLERHYTAGGFTHTFQRKGFEWDVGFHYIGDVHHRKSLLYKLFDYLSAGELAWAPMPAVYDRMVFPDASYDFVQGREEFAERLIAYFPDDRGAIESYMAHLKKVRRASKLFFLERVFTPSIGRILFPLLSRGFRRYSDRTTLDVLTSITKNKRLIAVLTGQYGDYGLPPARSSFAMHAMVACHYLWGGSYCVGGASRIAETMSKVIESAGGKVVVSAEVVRILVEKDRAVGVGLFDGNELRAPVVVSNAGAYNTFGRLLSEHDKLKPLREALGNIDRSVAHVCLYVGLDGSAETLGLEKTNLWLYPDYDHDRNCERYEKDPAAPFPVVYVSFPSAKDPSWDKKHPGKSTIEVIAPIPDGEFGKWRGTRWRHRGPEYEGMKQHLTNRLLEHLYQHVPRAKGKIVHAELSTPLSTRHFCNYDRGEIYGLEHTPARFQQRWLRVHTPIKALYLTGQDIFACGVSTAAFSGVFTASAILKRNMLRRLR